MCALVVFLCEMVIPVNGHEQDKPVYIRRPLSDLVLTILRPVSRYCPICYVWQHFKFVSSTHTHTHTATSDGKNIGTEQSIWRLAAALHSAGPTFDYWPAEQPILIASFHYFPQFLQANAETKSQNRPRPVPCTYVLLHLSESCHQLTMCHLSSSSSLSSSLSSCQVSATWPVTVYANTSVVLQHFSSSEGCIPQCSFVISCYLFSWWTYLPPDDDNVKVETCGHVLPSHLVHTNTNKFRQFYFNDNINNRLMVMFCNIVPSWNLV